MNKASEVRQCCQLECELPATVVVYGGSGHPEDYTESCDTHIGEMLATPAWMEKENVSWTIVLLEVTNQDDR